MSANDTIRIAYADIPSYLHKGEFYRNLSDEDPEDSIDIPVACFRAADENVIDIDDFVNLLRVMLFWVLDIIPKGIMDYCSHNDGALWTPIVATHCGGNHSQILLDLLAAYNQAGLISFTPALQTDRWELIVHAISIIDREKNGTQATIQAVQCGALRALQYLHERDFDWDEQTCTHASLKGHLNCLQYAHENGCPWNVEVYNQAALRGHLHCIQYAHEQGLEWRISVTSAAAQNGHLACLQYAHENGCPWEPNLHRLAGMNGHFHCVKYAHENGLPWYVDCCWFFVQCDRYECLVYAHENGCAWDYKVALTAAVMGRADCLRYALEHGCPIAPEACACACQNGHLQCLQLLHEFGAPWDASVAECAVNLPGLDCLKYLHENGCSWDEKTTDSAARSGHIDQLRYAVERGCPYNGTLAKYAKGSDEVRHLSYLVEDLGLEMDTRAFIGFLLKGNLQYLMYLLDQGCPFIDAYFFPREFWYICDMYFKKNNPDFVACVTFAVERGWPLQQLLIDYMRERDLDNCKQFVDREEANVIDCEPDVSSDSECGSDDATGEEDAQEHINKLEQDLTSLPQCAKCSAALVRHPPGTYGTGWRCAWPEHKGRNFLPVSWCVYGCPTVKECLSGICKTCWKRCRAAHRTLLT